MTQERLKALVLGTAACGFLGVATPGASGAFTTIFTDDFSDDTVGARPVEDDAAPAGNDWSFNTNDTSSRLMNVQNDAAGTLFNTGANNKYFQVSDNDSSNSTVATLNDVAATGTTPPTYDVLRWSFRIIETSFTGRTGGVNARLGASNNNSDATVDLFFNNGSLITANAAGAVNTITTYSIDTPLQIDVIANQSGDPGDNTTWQTYTDANGSVAAFTYDLYLNGNLIGNDLSFRNIKAADTMVFQVGGSNKNRAYIDDISLGQSSIPEPASLGAIAVAGLLAGRRRRQSGAARAIG